MLAEAFGTILKSFRLRMAQRPRQVEALEESLKDTTGFQAIVSTGQKEASRLFVPTIASWMSPAYAYCAGEKGKACSHPEDACVY
jgi:hypothetical protein